MIESSIPSAALLLAWYDSHRRQLAWRAPPGARTDPYRVWLSEVMLQQTTVAAVIPYYERFLSRFPTLQALAAAAEQDVLAAWAGLGYYSRARNLHVCARQVVALGGFPRTRSGLRALPGIGPYTAAAISAIAFDEPGVPVDGNVERVASRLFAIETPLPASKPALRAAAARLGEDAAAMERPGDFAQALFDLGATVCTTSRPACALCPWMMCCTVRKLGVADQYPRRAPRKARPLRYGVHFWLQDAAGRVLLRQRPPRGLLAGMMELPGTEWRAEPWPLPEALASAPQRAEWRQAGEVRHGLTHLELRIEVLAARTTAIMADGVACDVSDLAAQALPAVMRKCATLAMAAVGVAAPADA